MVIILTRGFRDQKNIVKLFKRGTVIFICTSFNFMNQPAESNPLINKDGSVFHLNLKSEHLSDVIITVGDPHRVFKVSQHFNDVEFEMNKREYITHIGKYKGKQITVISSGVGADNIEILMNELDYLTRSNGKENKKLKIVRIGTSVSIQDIPVGSQVFSNYSIGLDSLIQFYDYQQQSFEEEISMEVRKMLDPCVNTYCTKASGRLREQFAFDMMEGNSLTTPGYYAPQSRKLRISVKYPNLIDDLRYFHYKDFWITNLELETSAFYAFGRLLEHDVISLNVVTENRWTNTVAKDPEALLQELIIKVLDRA